jgi:fibronectin type 3 domain-containing protein
MTTVRWRARFQLGVASIGLGVAVSACATSFDFERAQRMLRGTEDLAVPALQEVPSGDLPAPEGLRATSGELRSVPLKWDPILAGDVGGYVVERALGREAPFERLAAVAGRTTTAYLDRGAAEFPSGAADATADGDTGIADLGDGITYFYRVRAYGPSGALGSGSEIAVATTAPPPAPPEGMRAYSHLPRQVPLSWRASDDPSVAGYTVERSPSSGGPFERLADLEGRHETIYVDRGLGDLRLFYYRVRARNSAGGQGEPSEPVRAVTKPEPLPPVGLRVVERRLGSNRLAWDPNVETNLAEYRLLRIREGADSPELVTVVPSEQTTATDGAVAADETVSYTLVAVDRDGLESAAAHPIAVDSEGYGLTATARRDGIHLAWDPRHEEGYRRARILRRSRIRKQERDFAEGGTYVDTDVTAGRSYRYVVVLETADASKAPPSSPVEITVPKP